jgi:hypothetical protein
MAYAWHSLRPMRILRMDSEGMHFYWPADEEAWKKFMKKCNTLAKRSKLTYGEARNLAHVYGWPVQIVRRAITAGIFQWMEKSRRHPIRRGRKVVRGPNGELRFEDTRHGTPSDESGDAP